MGLYKRKDSPYWWITFKINKRKKFESTGTKNKKRAELVYARRLTEIADLQEDQNLARSEARRRTFEELRDRYLEFHSKENKSPKSYVRDQGSFKHLTRFFGGMTLLEIRPSVITDYNYARKKEGAKPATIARELEVLRHALNLAICEWEWLEYSPFLKYKIKKPDNAVERWLTAEEEAELLNKSPFWLRELIIFALNTGMRQGEMLSLKWPQVDLNRRTATLLHTKNKEKRTVPLNQTVTNLLKAKGKVRHISGYVFTSQVGNVIDARNLLRAFYKARKEADVENLRWHDLRHTFATRLVQAGIDLYTVKELLGHKTITMTMRYSHHNTESIRHGVEVLDKSGYDLVTFNKKGLNQTG